MGERVQGVLDELRAESMRTATLVGLASIAVGSLWIHLFGTQSGAVLLATGLLVGVLYSDRPTPAHRAGARAGIFAPIPELTVQSVANMLDLWALSAGLGVKIALSVLVGALVVPAAWVLFAFFVVGVAFGTAWIVQRVRPHLFSTAGTQG